MNQGLFDKSDVRTVIEIKITIGVYVGVDAVKRNFRMGVLRTSVVDAFGVSEEEIADSDPFRKPKITCCHDGNNQVNLFPILCDEEALERVGFVSQSEKTDSRLHNRRLV